MQEVLDQGPPQGDSTVRPAPSLLAAFHFVPGERPKCCANRDAVQIALLRPRGVVADLELLDHPAAQRCHGNLLRRGSPECRSDGAG